MSRLNSIPGSASIPATCPRTPLEALAGLVREPFPFLLESRLPQGGLGRRSLVGARPDRVVRASVGGGEDPFDVLASALCAPGDWLAVGFLGYDARCAVEDLPRQAPRDHGFPEMHLAFYPEWGEYDEVARRWIRKPPPGGPADPAGAVRAGRPVAALTREGHRAAVERILAWIRAGDIFQANLTLRFEAPWEGRPIDLYRRLVQRTPAPFAAFLDLGDRQVVSASPERFLAVAGGRMETRPIKGTRPRTGLAGPDRAAQEELLGSEKDNAELAMIVDVARNDLGRVAVPGSVRVTVPRGLEVHPTVYHLAATVEADLAPQRTVVDILRAAFPAASITGAPKIRAMEIIDAVEPVCRAVYTGAIGYFRPGGVASLSVAIRTVLLEGGVARVGVGGGIVADSEAWAEYAEALTKGRALFDALGAEPIDGP